MKAIERLTAELINIEVHCLTIRIETCVRMAGNSPDPVLAWKAWNDAARLESKMEALTST